MMLDSVRPEEAQPLHHVSDGSESLGVCAERSEVDVAAA